MMDGVELRLIREALQHMPMDFRNRFLRLPQDAQVDVALTLQCCAESLAYILEGEDVSLLREQVDDIVSQVTGAAEVVV